jgi:hypothetical protein
MHLSKEKALETNKPRAGLAASTYHKCAKNLVKRDKKNGQKILPVPFSFSPYCVTTSLRLMVPFSDDSL